MKIVAPWDLHHMTPWMGACGNESCPHLPFLQFCYSVLIYSETSPCLFAACLLYLQFDAVTFSTPLPHHPSDPRSAPCDPHLLGLRQTSFCARLAWGLGNVIVSLSPVLSCAVSLLSLCATPRLCSRSEQDEQTRGKETRVCAFIAGLASTTIR